MLRTRGLDEGSGRIGATELDGNRDDLQALGVQLGTQGLPPGQVEAAASIGSPGNQNYLLAAQGRKPKR